MGFIRLFFHHGALIRFTLSNFAVLLHLRCTRPKIKNGKWISNDIDFWLSAIIKYISDDDTCARVKGYLKNCIVCTWKKFTSIIRVIHHEIRNPIIKNLHVTRVEYIINPLNDPCSKRSSYQSYRKTSPSRGTYIV